MDLNHDSPMMSLFTLLRSVLKRLVTKLIEVNLVRHSTQCLLKQSHQAG